MKEYVVYLVRCADNTFYTGISTEVVRRVDEHNTSSKGARYTSSRRPVRLEYFEEHPDRSSALKREYQIRILSHQQKQNLIDSRSVEK